MANEKMEKKSSGKVMLEVRDLKTKYVTRFGESVRRRECAVFTEIVAKRCDDLLNTRDIVVLRYDERD